MTFYMDLLQECIAKYLECKKILEKKDGESESYLFKYKAKSLLLKLKYMVTVHLGNLRTDDSDYRLFKVPLSFILCQIGILCLETEELPEAEEYFRDCLAAELDPLHPDFIIISIRVRNHLGFLLTQKSELEEAKKWLEEAEKLYRDFKCKGSSVAKYFYNVSKTGENEEEEKELEVMHVMTKFYLARVYGAQKKLIKSAIYCHETLRRELLYGKLLYGQLFVEHGLIDWALNSATLSQVFMEKTLFKQARHHLAAASCILDIYEKTLAEKQDSQEEMVAKREEFRHRSSDISRCWAKYGIFLLEHSKNVRGSTEEQRIEKDDEDLENLWFDNLDLSLYESQITDSVVVEFEDARKVFLTTQKHLNKAKEYYTLEDRASDHVGIIQDHSQLLRHLTAFEPDEDRQFKMMKKRVDMLKVVLKELNPRYYLNVCRQLCFELGETHHDMMQIKFQKAKSSNGVPAPQLLMKINALAESSIVNFNQFLDSIKDKKSKKFPDPLPEELIRPILIAHFYLGRLYYKYITQDIRKQIENTKKAYECFKFLVDNCERSEEIRRTVGEELNISKEMMTLLKMKALQL